MEKDKNYDPTLMLGGSVVSILAGSLLDQDGSNYYIAMYNCFTIPPLLRLLKDLEIEATGTVWINRKEKAPLKLLKEMEKLERGFSDIFTEKNSNATFVRWKNNKVVAVASTLYGQSII